MKAIKLKNVSFSYIDNEMIIDNVNLELDYSSINLIAGPSGEGKSTVMNIISGIIPSLINGQITGEVFIDEENISNKKLGDISRKVGIVLQNPDSQIIQKRVDDEIAFGLENIGVKPETIKKQINTVTKMMNLDPNWECRKLSLGQKQRLIIASILAMGQKIILLDEPLSSIDKKCSLLILNTLKSLKRAGYCIVIIEHRLDILLPYVDNIFHIENKQITKIENKEEYLKKQSERIVDICSSDDSTSDLFKLENISFKTNKREILKNISFSIPKGKRTLILGENGCGKTTLIQIIARLLKQSSGTIHQSLDSKFKEKKHGSKKWFKKVGYIFQNPDYQLFMPTVKDELYYNQKDKEYADKIASLFDIKKLYNRHPQSLSEGQKRRVSIAAILASRPSVVILDEPTVGQDYKHLKEMVNTLNLIHQQEKNTMIIITHDVRCASSLTDKAVLIEDGKVKEEGDKKLVEKFFSNLINKKTKTY